MSETVVHVETIEQWKSVLDVWFKQGYKWRVFEKGNYLESVFNGHSHYLALDNNHIYQTPDNSENSSFIEYKDFMAQQKEDNKMETYYVTQEQLDLIEELKETIYPLARMFNLHEKFEVVNRGLDSDGEKNLLRYLGGEKSIEFKVEEQLYRLWRINNEGDDVWFALFDETDPTWTINEENAFTAPLEEIKKWKTPAWEITSAD